jgi:hypothetical protein
MQYSVEAATYSVGWFTLALINAALPRGAGRSRLRWGLISFLIGPVATFLLVVWDPVTSPSR